MGTKGFGTDMVLDRWDATWTRNAAGGGGHYVYPVHSSHATMRAPSLPAALYLTLLRFLARSTRTCAAVGSLRLGVASDPGGGATAGSAGGVAPDSPDATAARLRLSMAAAGTPAASLVPWDTPAGWSITS